MGIWRVLQQDADLPVEAYLRWYIAHPRLGMTLNLALCVISFVVAWTVLGVRFAVVLAICFAMFAITDVLRWYRRRRRR